METRISGQALVDLKKEVTSFNAQLKQRQGNRTGEALDKDAFLKLLTIQMGKQDPLSPMKNTEFVAQMAQFTALEQMKNMNTSMEAMQKNLAVIPGFSMIGKEISYYDEGSESYLSGVAESILLGDGENPMIVVEGQKVSLENITSVKDVGADLQEKLPFPAQLPTRPPASAEEKALTEQRTQTYEDHVKVTSVTEQDNKTPKTLVTE